MGLTQGEVLAHVKSTIARHGSVLGVLKFSSLTTDQYQQGDPTFNTVVNTTGRGIRQPSADELSVIGDGENVEIAFVWSRLELIDKLSSYPTDKWLDNKDRIQFEGKVYRILSTHLTGKAFDLYSMVVCKAESLVGAANDPLP